MANERSMATVTAGVGASMARGAGRTRRRALRALPALAAGALLVGCGEADARGGWAGTVDTLASGAVGVSNPAGGVWEDGEE